MSHSLFLNARGMLKRKPPGYYEKIEQLYDEVLGKPSLREGEESGGVEKQTRSVAENSMEARAARKSHLAGGTRPYQRQAGVAPGPLSSPPRLYWMDGR